MYLSSPSFTSVLVLRCGKLCPPRLIFLGILRSQHRSLLQLTQVPCGTEWATNGTRLVGKREGGNGQGSFSLHPSILESAQTGLVSWRRHNTLQKALNSSLFYHNAAVFEPLITYEWRCQKQEAEEVGGAQFTGCVCKIHFSLASATSFFNLILPATRHQKKPTNSSKSEAKKIKI